ncbi:MAG TPA: non-canonical purine NTP pyrophosphatase [Acidobacteriaceae bacterium]|nr:non-canonical purine NTP pyrophosphatase [Acidobacteriaceae bacterium]
MRLYVATSNPGKLRDFAYAAEGTWAAGDTADSTVRIEIQPLPGLAGIPAPPEDELTFDGNARAKAIYYSRHTPGLHVLADDSGLEVTCLEGAPGVRSARYAEDQKFPSAPGSTLDERNNAALLRSLDGIPEPCRQGRYRCALALACDGKVVASADGCLEGSILTAPRGERGFGYDPLFFVAEFNRTMAELNPTERLSVSHRGRALRALLGRLPRM